MATTRSFGRQSGDVAAWPRWISLIVGVWLFISAFAWPHAASAQTNTWILGVLIAVVAIWAMFYPPVRWVNTILAVWLFISTFFFPHVTNGTVWNNAICAVIVFFASLAPGGVSRTMAGSTSRPIGAT